jgi:hypothetical protein
MTTTNVISQGWPFAPVGTSGTLAGGSPYAYHCHVSLLENNSLVYGDCDDSIEPINHEVTVGNTIADLGLRFRNRVKAVPARPGNADCEHEPNRGAWQDFTPTYDDETRNIIEAEVRMVGAEGGPLARPDRYLHSYMNDEEVYVELKNTTCLPATWSTVIGRHHNAHIISNAMHMPKKG